MDLSARKSFVLLSLQACRPSTVFLVILLILSPKPARGAGETWLEAQSPHFVVVSDAGSTSAQRVALHLEQMRSVFKKALPQARVDPIHPIVVYAVKNEESLKELIPQFWEGKGKFRPAGFFRSSPDQNHIVVRVDLKRLDPYNILNHEYFHLITEMNVPNLPVWLREGLAGFWENSEIRGSTVTMGRPSEGYLRLLSQRKLMPLVDLLEAGESSPYYNETQEASLFYAQSWALTHYLMIGDETGRSKGQLVEYVRLLQNGMEDDEARRRAFGDLTALEKELESYVRRFLFHVNKMMAPASIPARQLIVREISSAESAALRGDFLVRGRRFLEARALFDRALQEDPNLSLANLGMGLWHLRQDQHKEALGWFERAVSLGSRSCLAHYYDATLRLARANSEAELDRIARSLQRALELNPDFALALAQLAFVYREQNKNLEEALRLTQKAIDLEPTNPYLYMNAGQFLLSMDRFDEAREYGEKGLEVSEKSGTKSLLRSFVNKVLQLDNRPVERSHGATSARTQANMKDVWLKGQMRRERILTYLLSPDFSS
jgi:tetratricopeptide (TPR) repeat protein